MGRLIAAMACVVLVAAGCQGGNAERATEGGSIVRELDYRGFTAVDTGWGIDVKIAQSPTYRVALFADPVMAGKILVERSGSTLRIGRARRFYLPPWTLKWKARVEISMPTIERLSASGGSHADVAMDVAAGGVDVRLSGGSSLAGTITSATMEIDGSGGSSAELAGGTTRLELSGSGGSRFRMASFVATDLDARLSGGSSVEIAVSGSLTVRGSGGSHVVYRGDGRVERQELSGGSWVRKE